MPGVTPDEWMAVKFGLACALTGGLGALAVIILMNVVQLIGSKPDDKG